MNPKINMYLESNDISIDPLRLLWLVRLHPALNSKITKILTFLSIILCCIFLALAAKGVLNSYTNNFFFMSECLQTCILMTHIIGKVLTLHFHKAALAKLLKNKRKFWRVTDSEHYTLREKNLKTLNVVKKILRLYFSLFLSATIFFDVQPLTTGFLPTGCYVPEGWFNYLTVVLWYLSCVAVLTVVGTDSLFCSLVTSLIIQFKLLANRFRNMTQKCDTEDSMWVVLKELVDYHNFLLSYCEQLNSVFRLVFLLQFVMSIASSSVSVFIFMQPGAWTNRIKFLLYFFAIMAETGFYCVPLEITINTASEIDKAIYDSNWYEIRTLQFRKCLAHIINRTQKTLVFSGYGLIEMNLRTYLLICKTVFSFYTYLNSTRKLAAK